MNCMKNPRFKNRRRAAFLARVMEINTEHIAYLLSALKELYPKSFYPKACKEFIEDYMGTVHEFDCDNDTELKDHKIKQYLEGVPYISMDLARDVLAWLARRDMDKRDRSIYDEPCFADSFAENILLLLIQLHYSNGFGADRINAVVAAWRPIPEPFKWLEDNADITFEGDDMDVWNYLKEIDDGEKIKKKRLSTAREQLDARRQLEALKAYQEEVQKA